MIEIMIYLICSSCEILGEGTVTRVRAALWFFLHQYDRECKGVLDVPRNAPISPHVYEQTGTVLFLFDDGFALCLWYWMIVNVSRRKVWDLPARLYIS